MNELRTPMQSLNIQNNNLNDSVVINEDLTGEDYHRCLVKLATIPSHFASFSLRSNSSFESNWNLIIFPEISMQVNFSQIISFNCFDATAAEDTNTPYFFGQFLVLKKKFHSKACCFSSLPRMTYAVRSTITSFKNFHKDEKNSDH